jgi:hypothetical protein
VTISKADWQKVYRAVLNRDVCSIGELWRGLEKLGYALPQRSSAAMTDDDHAGWEGRLPADERWSEIATGVCANANATVEEVVARLVERPVDKQT